MLGQVGILRRWRQRSNGRRVQLLRTSAICLSIFGKRCESTPCLALYRCCRRGCSALRRPPSPRIAARCETSRATVVEQTTVERNFFSELVQADRTNSTYYMPLDELFVIRTRRWPR